MKDLMKLKYRAGWTFKNKWKTILMFTERKMKKKRVRKEVKVAVVYQCARTYLKHLLTSLILMI